VIFFITYNDSDRSDFLERLIGLTGSHAVIVHAYCLMQNHFLLQLQTPQPNLKEAMQRLLSGYAVRFNLRHRRAGPLFQGRYRAVLAGKGDCITEVNRYIHLNSVGLNRSISESSGRRRFGGESKTLLTKNSSVGVWNSFAPTRGVSHSSSEVSSLTRGSALARAGA
jgi:putative transposase